MSKNNNKGKRSTNTPANFIPPLNSGNSIKSEESDWWDEMCKRHGAKNHWAKKKKKKAKKKKSK